MTGALLSFAHDRTQGVAADYLRDPAIRALLAFFDAKGLAALKAEDRAESWYDDWIAYQAAHGIYPGLLSPAQWSTRGGHFDVRRLARFIEAFAYCSPAHAYSLHVSLLGILPILSGTNDALKREAVARLEAGELFAFAVSEQDHGSDLIGGDLAIRRADDGAGWIADGDKYYIGNANVATMVSVLAKSAAEPGHAAHRTSLTFFALRPRESSGWRAAEKIRTLGIRAGFVGACAVRGHRFTDADVIADGRDAWDAVFRTVDLGKFMLGFGAIGICEHALAEALDHLRRRVLYGKPASAMPHIRDTTVAAFARLSAMKMYATRALDFLQGASANDRRYLLYNAVQKARVTTEGVKVLDLLYECIGARGTESDTYFEMALRDAQLLPRLEGSTHINLAYAAQFIPGYFSTAGDGLADPPFGDVTAGENPYHFASHDRTAATVRFDSPLRAFDGLRDIANVERFARQAEAFGAFVRDGAVTRSAGHDTTVGISLGKCIAAIAYGQLVAESCRESHTPPALVSVIFQAMVEDLSVEAEHLSAALVAAGRPADALMGAMMLPATSAADIAAVAAMVDAA